MVALTDRTAPRGRGLSAFIVEREREGLSLGVKEHKLGIRSSDTFEIVLDGGPAPGGLPSTIVDLTRDRPLIVRVGAVPSALIEALFRS